MKKNIGIIVGSLRKSSYNMAVAKYMASILPDDYQPIFIDIGHLPLYNEDLESAVPDAWQTFRNEISKMDAFLFFTPEYNRSFSAVIKNAIDIASRPRGENKWSRKPVGIISASPGAIGGFGANQHLRQVLSVINMYPMQQPEAYLGHIDTSIDESGKIVSESLQTFLGKFIKSYIKWINRFISETSN